MIEEFFKKDPIEKVERELRFLVWDILSQKYGEGWIYNEEIICKQKWADELKKVFEKDKKIQHNGNIRELLISYADFFDIKELIKKNRSLFESVFSNFEVIVGYIETIIGLRNAIKHHRDISLNQQHLLIGICGEIIDAINLWRIGSKIELDRIVLSFNDYIATEGKSETQILSEAIEKINEIENIFLNSLKSNSIEIFNTNNSSDFETVINTQYIKIEIRANNKITPDSKIDNIEYETIHSRLSYKAECPVSLDLIMANTNKTYWVIEYLLKGFIDINRLKEWSERQAGLTPGSSVATNGSFDSIDYGFLGGKIRVQAGKYVNELNEICGKLSLLNNINAEKWNPHSNITPNDLIGFMLGNISSRTIMNLYRESLGK